VGEIVNQTFKAAMGWQQPAVWIRVNVAYIMAELPCLKEGGHDVAGIGPLMDEFNGVFSKFCAEEFELFVFARKAEAGAAEMPAVIAKLQVLRESFRPWLEEYHELVQDMQGGDSDSLSLGLMMGCGAELHQAHKTFINAVDKYAKELKGA
jgi:hypothetical protein